MDTELIKVDAQAHGISTTLADQIEYTFSGMVATLREFDDDFNAIIEDAELDIDEKLSKRANKLRNKIVKVRTGADQVRKDTKAEYQSACKAIDGTYNIFKHAIEKQETALMDIEKHVERIEEERLDRQLAWRIEKLDGFVDVENINQEKIRSMDGDVWIMYFQGVRTDYENRIEAEKKAEADRIAKEEQDAADREALRVENERLAAEALVVAKKIAADKKISDAKLAAEQEKSLKLQAEANKLAAAEQKRKRDEAAKIAAAEKKKQDEVLKLARASDEQKLASLRKQIEMLAIPELEDKAHYEAIKRAIKELYVFIACVA